MTVTPEQKLTPQERYQFDLNGYLVLEQALSPDVVDAINQWVDDHPAADADVDSWIGNVQVQSYEKSDGVMYQNIIEGGEVFENLLDHPAWIDKVRAFINCDLGVSLNENLLNVRGPGGYIGIHSGGHLPNFICNARHHTGAWMTGQINILMALTDVGPDDGPTTIVPGSHKAHEVHPSLSGGDQQTYRQGEPASEHIGMTRVCLNKGDALMFTDALTHGSAPRTNPGYRRILIYRYSPYLFVPRYNYTPSPQLLERLTPERRRIVQPIPPRVPPRIDAATSA